jgi:hypothetical protein
MFHWACSAVARMPQATLIVKLHPRSPDDPIAREVLSAFPSLTTRLVRQGALADWLTRADCVLSCVSSAGVEAGLARVPVIQLLPPGAGHVLPHDEWGIFGTARSAAELDRLLASALSDRPKPPAGPDPQVFGRLDGSASARMVDVILRSTSDALLSDDPKMRRFARQAGSPATPSWTTPRPCPR